MSPGVRVRPRAIQLLVAAGLLAVSFWGPADRAKAAAAADL